MVIRKTHALGRRPCSELRQAAAEFAPLAGFEKRPRRQRTAEVAVDGAAHLGEDEHRACRGLEEIEVGTKARELGGGVSLEKPRRVPPRNAREPEPAEYRRELKGVPRELVSQLDALEADLTRL